MMLKIRQIKLTINHNQNELTNKILKKLKIKEKDLINYQITKKSIDARDKQNIMYVYEINANIKNENQILKKHINDISKVIDETYKIPKPGKKQLKSKIIIVGSGPAGLFAGYLLAKLNYKPLIIERGEDIENRAKTVENFWKTNKLNPNSNVQFGAGGAGTFSDGKLNTNTKDKFFRNKEILKIFVKHGAPEEILYLNNPHIGTDILKKVIKNIINEIKKMGGEIKFNTCLTNINTKNNKLISIELNNKQIIPCNHLILATGHSSRDTFEMLLNKGLNIIPKPFAVGIRIQHPQALINKAQYGNAHLPPASYKLTYQTKNKRGVYSFCMCPGGYVVNASSEKNTLAINGMSDHARDSENANSAIIVTISPKDFGSLPLDGIKFQRNLETRAYQIGNGKIPIQLFSDFKNNQETKQLKTIKPIFKGNYHLTNIRNIFPDYINEALIEGITHFGTQIKGFDNNDAIIAAVESRTSSPIKIPRNENFTSNIEGIYPAGEGAGYAGGIMTSACDGLKVAEQIIQTYKQKE